MMAQPDLLKGRRILLVEDETLIAMLVEEMLTDLGCVVVQVARTVEEGLHAAVSGDIAIDAAILDVNIGEQQVFPVADALGERGLPFIFATGYGIDGLAPRYADHAVVAKPFRRAALEQLLRTALS